MRILENKEKKSILLKIKKVNEETGEQTYEKVYVALGNKEEEVYLKNVRDLLSRDLDKASYSMSVTEYLFIEKNGDEIVINRKTFEDEREARFGLEEFFEGYDLEIFEDSKVHAIKSIDKRIVVVVVIVFVVIFSYSLFNLVWPKKQPVRIMNAVPSVPANLDDKEKEKLKVIGSRLVVAKLDRVISSVRADNYARISGLTIQKSETPKAVSYILTAGKEYLYPQMGAASTNICVWRKTEIETLALGRSDIKAVESRNFDKCSLEMLDSGFYVKTRNERCVELTYEGEAARTVDLYNSIKDCYVSLNTLDINLGKGKIDVSFCKR